MLSCVSFISDVRGVLHIEVINKIQRRLTFIKQKNLRG